MAGSGARDTVRFEVPRAGALVASAGDWVVPVRPAGWEVVGRQALRAETASSIAAQARLANKPRFTQIGGDTALIIVDWNLEATLPDGTRISPAGTTTAVARRSADGSWRFAVLQCQGTARSPGWRTAELPAGA
jgi:ketosteroid isomerase-like protein